MNNVVWSVNMLLGIGLIGVAWVLYHILNLAYVEIQNEEKVSHHSNHDETSDT